MPVYTVPSGRGQLETGTRKRPHVRIPGIDPRAESPVSSWRCLLFACLTLFACAFEPRAPSAERTLRVLTVPITDLHRARLCCSATRRSSLVKLSIKVKLIVVRLSGRRLMSRGCSRRFSLPPDTPSAVDVTVDLTVDTGSLTTLIEVLTLSGITPFLTLIRSMPVASRHLALMARAARLSQSSPARPRPPPGGAITNEYCIKPEGD